MRILIIQPWIKQGGAENASLYLAYYLSKMGHKTKIAALFCDLKETPAIASRVEYLLPDKRLSRMFKKSRLFFFFFGLPVLFWLVLIGAGKADILNPHNFPSCWVAVLAAKLCRKPVVWHCHEPPAKIPLEKAKRVAWTDFLGWFFASGWLDKRLVKEADAIIVPSKQTQRQVWRRYKKNSSVIHFGVDGGFYGKKGKEKAVKQASLRGKFILLTVGKLHFQKNQIICLRALKLAARRIPEIVLVLVGEGPDLKKLKAEAEKLGIAERVIFRGFISSQELREWYRLADINLFPAVNQSWGLAPLEALCGGTISIVSDGCGVAEILEKEKMGIVCPAEAQAFAKNILRVYRQQEEFRKAADRGAAFIKKNLSWPQYASRNLKIMKKVWEGKSE